MIKNFLKKMFKIHSPSKEWATIYEEYHKKDTMCDLCKYECKEERRTKMIKLENWTEVTKGLYRYVVAAGCCYEIHIIYHAKDTDILTANASLYIVGDWTTANGYCSYFERELLLNGPLMACLEKAVEDGREMEE